MWTMTYTLTLDEPLMINGEVSMPGIYDRVTVLDHGLPYVPATTLSHTIKATLRAFLAENQESWEAFRICRGQNADSTTPGGEAFCPQTGPHCPLCRIFGSPGGLRRGFEFTGAYHSKDDVDAMTLAFGEDGLTDASLVRRARNQYDAALRRGREDHLFFDGAADLLADLRGEVWEEGGHRARSEPSRRFDYRLVLLGLRLTQELGGSRNRGYGACDFRLDGAWAGEIQALCDEWAVNS